MRGLPAIPDSRTPLPYPDGWFVACFSDELKRGAVLTVPFMGKELVLYRTQSGQARVITPYCPHLGAHLGHGGRVEGETLICPYHGLAYGQDGRCVRVGNRQDAHCRAALGFLPLRDVNGLLLVWHHDKGAPPSWEPPVLDYEGYSRQVYGGYPLRGYMQDLMENTADALHFEPVHRWKPGIYSVSAPKTDGHIFITGVERQLFGLKITVRLTCYGLGFVVAESHQPELGLDIKFIVAATAITPLDWIFRHSEALRLARFRGAPDFAKRIVYSVLCPIVHRWTAMQYREDLPIWNNRSYLEHPALSSADGYFAIFRRWTKQFYSATSANGDMAKPPPASSDGDRALAEFDYRESVDARTGQIPRLVPERTQAAG